VDPLRRTMTADDLRNQVTGPVLLPGDSGYEAEARPYNTACAHRAAAVVGARNTADIEAAVRYSGHHGRAVAVQCTGHGAFAPADDAVLVSTRRMTGLSIDAAARTARIEAGVRWGQVIAEAAKYDLAPLHGSSPSVGAVGFTLGGGLGPLGRRYGFAADRVRRLEIVTGDAVARTADPDRNADLFWAARGGKGNFGIVTAMEVDLFPVRRIYAGCVYFDARYTGTVLHAFRDWVEGLQEDTTASVALVRMPTRDDVHPMLRGRFTVQLRVVHLGDPAAGQALLAPMRSAAPSIRDTVADVPYSSIASVYNDPTEPFPFWEKATLLRELSPAAVESVVDIVGPDADSPFAIVDIRHMGGALSRPPEHANAVAGREGKFSVTLIGSLKAHPHTAMDERSARLLHALSPVAHGTGAGLMNFLGNAHTPDDVARAWPAATYRRLQRVKRAYDPSNTFRVGYPIAPR
jgi:FAD/FMN-containing dehydrogenase